VALPIAPEVADDRRSLAVTHRRRDAFLLILTVLIVVLWSAKQWQWSLVDDADYRLNLLLAQRQDGWYGGIADRVQAAYEFDRAGGQFRPFLWVYSSTFYLVGPQVGHGLRLLTLLVAVGSIGFAVRSRLAGRTTQVAPWVVCAWAVLAVLSIRGVFDGLSFLSIMELPAIAFAALAAADRSSARKVMWLTLASLCKTPVVGGLFALAVVLRRRRRSLALVAVVLGAVIVGWGRQFALGGSYTAEYRLTADHAINTIRGLARQLALPCVVLGTGFLWVRWRVPRVDTDAFVLAAAGLGYVLLLLPWGSSSGYNLAAPAFLLVAAAALQIAASLPSSHGTNPGRESEPALARSTHLARQWVPLVLAAVIAATVCGIGIKATLDRDSTIRAVVDWADSLPEEDTVATNGTESAVRYGQLLALRHGGHPSQTFVAVPGGSTPECAVTWVVAMHDQGPLGGWQGLSLDRQLPTADIYRFADSGGNLPPC
jgi:hypothetical protein